MQKQDVTIYDVAREAKVSMATVSRVVNGNTNVRKETRERVNEAIKRLNYQPNAVAQGLASKRTTTVGLVVPELTNLYFAELSKGIDDIAHLYNYNIIITSVESQLAEEDRTIQGLLNRQVDGVIYMANDIPDSALEAFDRSNVPVVLAGTIDNRHKFPNVSIDYEKANEAALELMRKDGKKNLAFVSGSTESSVNRDYRVPAYRKYAEKHGFEAKVYEDVKSYSEGYELFAKLRKDNVDGILITRDVVACGVMNAALDSGFKIPEDLEIVTLSATEIASVVRPSLTAVKQPLYDMGAIAMRLLTKMMNDEDYENHMALPFQILKRGTTLNRESK